MTEGVLPEKGVHSVNENQNPPPSPEHDAPPASRPPSPTPPRAPSPATDAPADTTQAAQQGNATITGEEDSVV